MIKNQDAEQKARETYKAAAKALEAKIDIEISRNTSGAIYVDVGGIPRPAVDAVAEKFRKEGGWTVHYGDSQRDGATLTLS